MAYTPVFGIEVDDILWRFVREEALPGSGVAEAAFWDGLAGLIRDAACLKSYFSGCMELCREAHRSAGNALNAGIKTPYPVKKIKSPAEQKAAKAKAKEEAKKKKKAPSTDTSKTSVGSDGSSVPPPAPPQAAAQAKNAKGGSGKSSVRSANDLYGDDIEMPSPA